MNNLNNLYVHLERNIERFIAESEDPDFARQFIVDYKDLLYARINEVSLAWIAKKSASGFKARGDKSRGTSRDRDTAMSRIRKKLGDRSGGADEPEARTVQHSFHARRGVAAGGKKPKKDWKEMRRSKMDPKAGEQRTVRPELAKSRNPENKES